MIVFEYKQKLKLKKTMFYEELSGHLAYFIDSALCKNKDLLDFHKENKFKNYVFDLLYPNEKNKMYQSGKVYTFRIRTISQELAEYFVKELNYHSSIEFEGVGGELQIVQKKILDKVYSLSPVLIKLEQGYWKEHMKLEDFEQRIYVNLIHKYEQFCGVNIQESVSLYDLITFRNKKPVRFPYKGKILLGDQLEFQVAKNEIAQDLWYMALGTGILEHNARGAGFLHYRYL